MGWNGKPKSCFELFAETQDRHRPGGGTVARLTSKEAWTGKPYCEAVRAKEGKNRTTCRINKQKKTWERTTNDHKCVKRDQLSHDDDVDMMKHNINVSPICSDRSLQRNDSSAIRSSLFKHKSCLDLCNSQPHGHASLPKGHATSTKLKLCSYVKPCQVLLMEFLFINNDIKDERIEERTYKNMICQARMISNFEEPKLCVLIAFECRWDPLNLHVISASAASIL
jgi:hypothetical protein